MWSFFNKPFPYSGETRHNLLNNFFIALFVAMFLAVFQPFSISEWQTENKILKLFGFGMVSFVAPTLLGFIIGGLFGETRFVENWNVTKEIANLLLVLVLIAFGNMAYGRWLQIMPFSLGAYVVVFGITCAVGIFPVTLHVFLKHNRLLKKSLEESRELNKQLEKHKPRIQESQNFAGPAETKIELVAENNKDKLNLDYKDLLYIESADNYSNIYYLENNARKKVMLRGSLKRLESQIMHPMIVRCHRAYIVNLACVSKVEGNAAGYRLFFDASPDNVPVSRNYVAIVTERLKTPL